MRSGPCSSSSEASIVTFAPAMTVLTTSGFCAVPRMNGCSGDTHLGVVRKRRSQLAQWQRSRKGESYERYPQSARTPPGARSGTWMGLLLEEGL